MGNLKNISPDEVRRPYVAEGAAHEPEAEREQGHVAEVERSLEQPVHPAKKKRKMFYIKKSFMGPRIRHAAHLVLKKK